MNRLNIALTLSGGGYRAASFHLGVISYLHHVNTDEYGSLLEQTKIISTVSGGTITGMRYLSGVANGENVQDIFRDIYRFMTKEDLPALALADLDSRDKHGISLIKIMARIYDQKLFHNAEMGSLMDYAVKRHGKHFSANATDFVNGLPFRFQATEKIRNAQDKRFEYGLIGNEKITIDRNLARSIRLGDILACSSCFPGGFEPMMFPNDFNLPEPKKKCLRSLGCIGIMDGGIVDNQGIESVLLAEKRMKQNECGRKDICIDLIITSDVWNPHMESYSPTNSLQKSRLGKLKLKSILNWITGGEIMATMALLSGIWTKSPLLLSIVGAIWITMTSLWIGSLVAIRKIKKMAGHTLIGRCLDSVLRLRLADIATLAVNRFSSVKMLVTIVFMKHIRRLNYRSIYENKKWMNRRIMNGIYELRAGEKWEEDIKKGRLPKWLAPCESIQKNSSRVADMETTLWFTDSDKCNHIPEALIAAGQYTICWKLLSYIEKSKKYTANMTEAMIGFCKEYEESLRTDWEKFQKNPLWMVEEITSDDRPDLL